MRFPPSFLDEIRARVSISSVIGRSVQWDRKKSNPGRGDHWACCPFHEEKTPSFHADDRKGRYHCFGCKASGDIFRFLTEKEGLSFPEAVERLAGEAGLEMPKLTPQEAEREKHRATLYDVMDLAAQFFQDKLHAPEGAAARGYLADRGLSAEIVARFRIGYAPGERRALKDYLAAKEVTAEQIAESGLVVTGEDIAVPFDRFRDRIMFPIRDNRGQVIAFGGRAMSADVPAKYLNSPEGTLFHKGRVLYNIDQARGPAYESGTIVAAEGYMDVIALTRAGVPNAVAPLGTALTEDQLQLLWRMAPEPVLCFDGDQAGLKAAYRALDLALPLLQPGTSLRFAMLPDGQDPDDLLRGSGAETVRGFIQGADPLVGVLWRRALDENSRQTPEQRARFEVDLEQSVQRIGDQKVRAHYAAEIRERIKALWAGQGGRQFMRGGPANRWTGQARKGARGRGRFDARDAWQIPSAPSAALKALASNSGDPVRRWIERREQLIVLTVINHPVLLDMDAELFCEVEFSRPELDRLRSEIIDIAALCEGLDSSALRDQLSKRGKTSDLARIDGQSKRLETWFALAGAALEDARTGFRQMIALHRKTVTLERELKVAELALAEDPSETTLSQLNGIREELRSSIGEEAAIEGFGEASGRVTGSVA